MKILHISDKRIGDKNFISGIKSVLLEEIRYENKIFGVVSKVLLLKNSNEKNNLFIFGKDINKKILEYNPDFIIFDGFWIFQHYCIAKFLIKNKIKYYIKPHGSFNKIAQKNSKIKYIKKIIARKLIFNNYVKNSNGLIFLNEEEKKNSIYHKKNEFILSNGIERLNIKLINKQKEKEKINFIFLGRIDIFHKGLDILLDMILKNKEYFIKNNIVFNFYGKGNKKDTDIFDEYLFKMPEIIKYCGIIYGDEKYKVLQENDIFILTSRFEGMPMGVLEALSIGTPCFISKETGMGKYIEEYNSGWVNKNTKNLFEDLRKCIEDYKKNSNLYRENSLKCRKIFYWENIVKKLYEKEYKILRKI